jgi:general secretion pathway protein D
MVRDENTPVLPPADAPTTPFVDPRGTGPVPGPLPLPQSVPQTAPQSAQPVPLTQQRSTGALARTTAPDSGHGN